MKPLLNSVSTWFGLMMILIVVSGAIAFAFTDFMSDRIYGGKRTFFIFLLTAYAVYRGVRIYQTYKQSRYED